MTVLTMILVAVLLIKKTPLAAIVASGAVVSGLLVNSDIVITDYLNKIIILASINAVLTFSILSIWERTRTDIAKILSILGVAFLCLSFAQLFTYANVLDASLHDSYQTSISGLFDYLTMIVIAMLLFHKDDAGREYARDFWFSVCRFANRYRNISNREDRA